MRKLLWFLSLLICLVFGVVLGVSYLSSVDEPRASLSELKGNVARGAYLARVSGCIACHTDSEAKGKPLAGGKGTETPFGTFYAPNLTADREHGIGTWSVDDFERALRAGKSPSGQSYYPAFPYSFYARLSDQDVVDLWAAFKTVPAVAKPSTVHQVSFPFNINWGLDLWQLLFFDEQRFIPDAKRSEQYNRGAYLVQGPAHCGACHTPRNLLGGLDTAAALSGHQGFVDDDGVIPAITAGALAKQGWSEADLAYSLKSGVKQDGDVFGGSMGEVVRDGAKYLKKSDREAIAHYLLTRP